MSLSRDIAPGIKPVEMLSIPEITTTVCSNGISLYCVNRGDQDVCRIDLMIEAGKWVQDRPLVSFLTNQMLKEGAGSLDSGTIAERLDFYGAWIQLSVSQHYSYLTVYMPNRFFDEIIDLLELIVKDPVFPESEFQTLLNRTKQQFLVSLEKVSQLSSSALSCALFGTEHPYGRVTQESDFDQVKVSDLSAFFKQYYSSDCTRLVLSGKISDRMIRRTEQAFGSEKWGNNQVFADIDFDINPSTEREIFVEKSGALQNGIRMGIPTINRTHPDYPELRVLNTIFGGYFGSRLMSNIREDKGYTYGISSGITNYRHAAFWSVGAQTAVEFTRPLIAEVYKEIDRLHQELVGPDELERVKSFMLGDFMRSLDGVFSLVDYYISLIAAGLPLDFYRKQMYGINQVSGERLQQLAQQYLLPADFYTVIAGNKIL